MTGDGLRDIGELVRYYMMHKAAHSDWSKKMLDFARRRAAEHCTPDEINMAIEKAHEVATAIVCREVKQQVAAILG